MPNDNAKPVQVTIGQYADWLDTGLIEVDWDSPSDEARAFAEWLGISWIFDKKGTNEP